MIVSVLSARPGRGRVRSTKLALNGSVLSAASGSGCWPLIRSSRRERKRVSRKKRPWGRLGTMSPARDEMQNEEPWTRVTDPQGPPSVGLSPSNVHGSEATDGDPTAAPRPSRSFSPMAVVLID
jgi:hypothetical protein